MPRPTPPKRVVKRTYLVYEEQDKALKHLAADTGKSVTDLIREALDEYLGRREEGKRK